MLAYGARWWLRLRRLMRRSEWTARLLRMTPSRGAESEPGLVLVQIDGLSRRQLQRAIADGRMPYLRRLLRRESYRLHSLYSGVPSTTPSVLGELFYGERSVVPAFSFRDPDTGRVVAMLEPEVAQKIERRLQRRCAGLLSGGAAYADIYGGGAAQASYCATSIGWSEALRAANPLRLMAAAVLHAPAFLRVAVLLLIELAFAVGHLLRGDRRRRAWRTELMHVPLRVAVVVLLRELTVIGAMTDVTVGTPIVHLNLLGYDEQAHHRGPASAVAQWTLGGIDRSIRRIAKAAHASSRRHYQVWVYSDHGQEACEPYLRIAGAPFSQRVAELFQQQAEADDRDRTPASLARARWLGAGGRSSRRGTTNTDSRPLAEVSVASNGPIGLIYPMAPLDERRRAEIAERLVDELHCPAVLTTTSDGAVHARTRDGWCELPDEGAAVFGEDHPFLREVSLETFWLAKHRLAGELLACGWTGGQRCVSFADQNGCHGGPGSEETHAFALTPSDAPLSPTIRRYLRADDLRQAAMRVLLGQAAPPDAARPRREDGALRLLTYNVHGCMGMDGRISPRRIASVIARSGADVVALQELDVGRRRSDGLDQAQEIAQFLEMAWEFHPAWTLEEEGYGDAVLSRLPLRLVRGGGLPGAARLGTEPRGALWVEIDVGPHRLQLINTHLGLRRSEQFRQTRALLGADWVRPALGGGPTVLCGDFNFTPRSRPYRLLTRSLRDASTGVGSTRPTSTFFSWAPLLRIDHVFVQPSIGVESIGTIRTELARVASDHLPVVADLTIGAASDASSDDEDPVACGDRQRGTPAAGGEA